MCAVSRISFHLLFECALRITYTEMKCVAHIWRPLERTTHTHTKNTIPDKSMVCVIYILDVCLFDAHGESVLIYEM